MEVLNEKLDVSTRVVLSWLFILRHETKYTKIHLTLLDRRNQHSKAAVVGSGGPVVSVTTHGERLKAVHLVLESIAAGSTLPSRLILWVDRPESLAHPSLGLRRLVDRGLEIRLSDNFGPHTKYYPYLLSADRLDCPLVTADDDLLYSKWWLEGLVRSHNESPEEVNCYRAHLMRLADGTISPYRTWGRCESTSPSFLHFATGTSGCIYPPSLQKQLKLAGPEFLDCCPKADDVWLHVNAVRAGIKIRQVCNRPLRFPVVPGTQQVGLYRDNCSLERNDEHIRKTYTTADIALLESLQK